MACCLRSVPELPERRECLRRSQGEDRRGQGMGVTWEKVDFARTRLLRQFLLFWLLFLYYNFHKRLEHALAYCSAGMSFFLQGTRWLCGFLMRNVRISLFELAV